MPVTAAADPLPEPKATATRVRVTTEMMRTQTGIRDPDPVAVDPLPLDSFFARTNSPKSPKLIVR
ncbi:hypothetical protein nbrc107697_12970 [Gordonia crocea]|uniref:Uncharacterized protein n=1 Tax=Gordonia crocea TaxID=589162 RepID=A0A7I9UVQ3_9ACTN|nr:hypothetical protein nbrc107697_12970 [Gordonia crocea]